MFEKQLLLQDSLCVTDVTATGQLVPSSAAHLSPNIQKSLRGSFSLPPPPGQELSAEGGEMYVWSECDEGASQLPTLFCKHCACFHACAVHNMLQRLACAIFVVFKLQIKDLLKPEVTEEIVLQTRQRLLELEG